MRELSGVGVMAGEGVAASEGMMASEGAMLEMTETPMGKRSVRKVHAAEVTTPISHPAKPHAAVMAEATPEAAATEVPKAAATEVPAAKARLGWVGPQTKRAKTHHDKDDCQSPCQAS
jgi:hypothetical protein